MNTNPSALFFAVTFGLIAISTVSCAEKAKSSDASLPSVQSVTAAQVSHPLVIEAEATNNATVTSAQWSDIQEVTFDLRAQFFSGLKLLEAKVDDQISELTARRATMNSHMNTQDWDFAMKEMGDSRTYLTSMGVELKEANPETWNQGKEKVGKAWVRTQDAYAKVKASTTS